VTGVVDNHAEKRLRVLLLAHAAWSAVLAIGYIVGGETRAFGFMPNSFAKDALFVALSLLAAWDVRRNGWLTLVIVAGYLALIAGQASALAWGGSPDLEQFGVTVSATAGLLGWMAIDLVLVVWFTLWWFSRCDRRCRRWRPSTGAGSWSAASSSTSPSGARCVRCGRCSRR
jgi:hypothetical protein